MLWVLRDKLKLTGTSSAAASPSTAPAPSTSTAWRSGRVTPLELAAGREITTIEGIGGEVADAVLIAWIAHDVPQCGYCQSDQVMSAVALLSEIRARAKRTSPAAWPATYTGLATIVAEELGADWSQMRAESAPANAARYNNLAFGQVQGTGGSTAIKNSYEQLRKAGAEARAMLVQAAAEEWGSTVCSCEPKRMRQRSPLFWSRRLAGSSGASAR